MSEIAPGQDEVIRMQQAIVGATEAVCGDPHANPLEVFPNPATKERREDVVFGVDLSAEQEEAFRASMADLGPGRTEDKNLDVRKLSNEGGRRRNPDFQPGQYEWKAALDGGQLHKVMAELELVLAQQVPPSMIVVTGAIGRKIGEAEKALSARLMNIEPEAVSDTEYGVERQFVEQHPYFQPLAEGIDGNMPVNYDLGKGSGYGIQPTLAGDKSSNQFVKIGTLEKPQSPDSEAASIPVVFIRMDRFPDPQHPDDPSKYIQPSNAQKITYAAALQAPGEYDVNIVFVSSATYEPSCELAARQALIDSSPRMTAQVLSYGTERLAAVKGEDPKQPDLHQLASEAYKTAKMLRAVTGEQ